MSEYLKARPGDRLGEDELTAQGAAALNGYRREVASGARPSAAEVVVNAVIAEGRLRQEEVLKREDFQAAREMLDEDKKLYPGRRKWGLNEVNAWLAARFTKAQDSRG